jgi:hypothetical protein
MNEYTQKPKDLETPDHPRSSDSPSDQEPAATQSLRPRRSLS